MATSNLEDSQSSNKRSSRNCNVVMTQLTPGQRVVNDDDDSEYEDPRTCVKQLFVSNHQRITVTPDNVEELYGNIDYESPPNNRSWPKTEFFYKLNL